MKLPLSAFIICQDEIDYLGPCIDSLDQCAEIIIVDSGSSDGTQDLIKRYQAEGWPIKFIEEPWRGFGAQKQFALEQCTQDWCLSIDSDERVSRALHAALPKLLEAPEDQTGWRLTRYPYLIGYGYVPEKAHERHHIRLFRHGGAHFDPTDKVHEGLHPHGEVKKCHEGGLLHYRPLPLGEQILKENKYSSLKAAMKHERGQKARPWKMIFSPPLYFFRWYFRYGLWRCGWPGFIQAATFSVYSFLTEAKHIEFELLKHKPNEEPKEEDSADY